MELDLADQYVWIDVPVEQQDVEPEVFEFGVEVLECQEQRRLAFDLSHSIVERVREAALDFEVS